MKNQKKKNRRRLDNHGSAIVMVLIMIAFLGLLSGILMFASYGGYQMKLYDKQGKDNFYTAEMVLDEINVGLQTDVATALTAAYEDVMRNYSLYETPAKRNQALYDKYYEEVEAVMDGDHNGVGDIADLLLYLSDETTDPEYGGSMGDGDGTRDGFGTYGAIVEATSTGDVMHYAIEMEADKGILLKGIEVTYVDKRNNVAIISTDIRIAMPRLNFSESAAFPDLNHYSLIADGSLRVENTTEVDTLVKGNVYAKELLLDGATAGKSYPKISFEPAEDAGEEEKGLVVYKDQIRVQNGQLKTTDTELWAKNILIASSVAELDGSTYVKNDLELAKLRDWGESSVTLSGTYTGYGNSSMLSAESSAILINGRGSSLDLSGLENMNISGHAYIGTAYNTATGQPVEAENGSKEIRMGESIAVKSDQIAYLIPAEALGCEVLSDGTIGDSVFRSNPLKEEQYSQIKKNSNLSPSEDFRYWMVDTEKPIKALGFKTLKDYHVSEHPDIIYKQTNAGPLVYCYLLFEGATEEEKTEYANQYFADYYGLHKEEIDKYTRLYASEIRMAQPDAFLNLRLAGNAMTYVGEQGGKVIDARGDMEAMETLSEKLDKRFLALNTKLVPNLGQLTAAEQGRSVFHNIIDADAVTKIIDEKNPGGQDVILWTEADGHGKQYGVYLTKGDCQIPGILPSEAGKEVHMIIALGNVIVNNSFDGTIFSAKDVIVQSGMPVELSAISLDDFTELMMAKDDEGKYYAMNVFRDGVNYASSGNKMMDYGTMEISLADLIVFERWSKK